MHRHQVALLQLQDPKLQLCILSIVCDICIFLDLGLQLPVFSLGAVPDPVSISLLRFFDFFIMSVKAVLIRGAKTNLPTSSPQEEKHPEQKRMET